MNLLLSSATFSGGMLSWIKSQLYGRTISSPAIFKDFLPHSWQNREYRAKLSERQPFRLRDTPQFDGLIITPTDEDLPIRAESD